MPETRQEPSRNDKNPLKHWAIQKKIAPAAHRPSTQFGGIGAKPFRQRQGYLHERDRVRPQVHPGPQMNRLFVCLQMSRLFRPIVNSGYNHYDVVYMYVACCSAITPVIVPIHDIVYNTRENRSATPCRYYAAAVQCHAIRGSLRYFGRLCQNVMRAKCAWPKKLKNGV